MQAYKRCGVTLLELLVAIALVAVLVGLLIPAVQKVRLAAARAKSANKLRQLVVASHALSDRHGTMPILEEFVPGARERVGRWTALRLNQQFFSWNESPMFSLVHELDGQAPKKYSGGEGYYSYTDAPHQSPADPNYDMSHPPGHAVWVVHNPDGTTRRGDVRGNCSYVVNALAATSAAPLHTAFADGTSNTAYLAETYCKSAVSEHDLREMSPKGPFRLPAFPGLPAHSFYSEYRRATFADAASGDVHPVTTGTPAVARPRAIPQSPKVTGETTFQCAVPLPKSTGKVPYSPYPGGLQVGMADGSVRMVRVGTAETVFWGLVTPAGGEVAALD